jgi:hypothetical protein
LSEQNEVFVKVRYTLLVDDSGRHVAGVSAECSECEHVTESFGTDERSRVRCLAQLRDECPRGENNWYVDDESEDEDEAEVIAAPPIPIRTASELEDLEPIYVTRADDYSGPHGDSADPRFKLRQDFIDKVINEPAVRAAWFCPVCKMQFFRRKSCEKHILRHQRNDAINEADARL